MSGDQVAGVVRAIVAAIGGYLVGKGLIDQGTATTIGGAVVTILTAVWSVWSKR